MRVDNARFILFIIWMVLFVTYFFMLLMTHKTNGIAFDRAFEAAAKMVFVLLPIVSAFGAFWFQTQRRERTSPPGNRHVIERKQCFAMFAITGVVNLLVILYFLIGVVLADFDHPDMLAEAFTTRVDRGVQFFVFLSSLVALPVGFVLGEEVHVGEPAAGPPPQLLPGVRPARPGADPVAGRAPARPGADPVAGRAPARPRRGRRPGK